VKQGRATTNVHYYDGPRKGFDTSIASRRGGRKKGGIPYSKRKSTHGPRVQRGEIGLEKEQDIGGDSLRIEVEARFNFHGRGRENWANPC